MVDDVAERIHAARTDARILAPLIVACPGRRTVGVDDTLRVLAFGPIAHHPADTVGPAR